MAGEDDTESCNSRPWDASPKSSRTQQHHRLKMEVYHQVLQRLQDSDCPDVTLPDFQDQLWVHFNRLPPRYALDVNVERAEDVVAHMKLLRLAQLDPLHFLGFHLRPVQVSTNTNGFAGDSIHSYSSMDEGSQGSVKTSTAVGIALSLHSGPSFGSTQNLEALEDRDSFINNCIPSTLRTMHEITFSAVDKPKLLSQLTSLLSGMSLNIQEAHAFSTADGFSLDVFVVDGWPAEETDELRSLLEKEIHNMKQPQSEKLPSPGAGEEQQKANCLGRLVKESGSGDINDIDQSLLKLGCKVASGSHGDLYRGAYCGQEVAIKVLKPERVIVDVVKEFFQEVNIMRRLQHKNVVQFIGACTKPPNLFLVTEFMPKGNLYDFMHKRKGVFNFESLLKAAIDISMGMEYLHQNDILHRDLKTANLLMGEDGIVKVADFGIARVKTQPGVMTAETGTYRWMAPEVISHKPYDHKADVFSFGIVLWELITGELPYSYLTPLQAAIGVVQKGLRPVIPDHTHPKLTDLLKRCWLQESNLRPDFSEIIRILNQIANKDVKEESDKCQDKPSGEGFILYK